MQYIIEANGVDFSYMDGTRAIKNLSIRIERNKKYAIVGNNGAGKTTLFLHFNGVHQATQGEIRYNGQKVNYSNNKQLKELRKNIGIVFQNPDDQLFSASVYQDISFGPGNLGWPEPVIREKIKEVMYQTDTWELRDRPTHFLSYGQKKRVCIAGILAMEPQVIILDEPTAGLDPVCSTQIMELLNTVQKETGATILFSTHNIDEAYAWADEVFVMHDGQIIEQGLPVDVFRKKDILAKANLIKPWVLDVYDKLNREGNASGHIPKTRDELMAYLAHFV
ncbi:MAG: ATP-binding cassette domain-containing protein [Bacillota bacterium]|nr:ATP-binding cassette domain-containing protein [Bacillota bacterium]MDW7684224.1 ATP-binding cassette domain-containing protein [Bacillota bacterium]